MQVASEWVRQERLRATSHSRLRAHDHHTSSTLIGGKGGAGPTSAHSVCMFTTCNILWLYSWGLRERMHTAY